MPTPVSALIHAATMVTAGVYLLMRTSPLIEYSSTVLILCLWLGAITTVFSSLIGLFQQDIKKVIAYSTMSQMARECINNIDMFRHQTICVEVIYIINSQITKAHNYLYNYISISFFNSFSAFYIYIMRQYCYRFKSIFMSEKWKVNIISKLVGISEAIRLILIYFLRVFVFNIFTSLFSEEVSKLQYYLNLILNTPYKIICLCLERLFLKLVHSYYNLNSFFFYLNSIQVERAEFTEYSAEGCLGSPGSPLNLTQRARLKDVNPVNDLNPENSKQSSLPFYEWLAGVIDGDGYFHLSKKGTARFTVVMDIRDKQVLYEIKHKLGGSIYTISNANALRYQLSHRKGLICLINAVNGLIRNPTRMLQMNKLCVKYDIELLYPKPLIFNNGWLSGFIDSDGSIYLNEISGQVFISVSQKNRYLLEPLIKIYSGRVDISSPKTQAFKYIIYRKSEVFNMVDNYFSKYPLKSKKQNRVNLIKEFFEKRPSLNNKDITNLNKWISFKDRWDKYID